MKQETIKLSLLDNSHAFLKEAVVNAIQAEADPRRWQFAILHLVQANELGLKAALEQIHPMLIYEDIDSARPHTVNPSKAIKRLQHPAIGKLKFSAKDIDRVHDAIQLRNEVTHQHFELNPQNGAAKFFALLPFVLHFQETHLKTNIKRVILTKERRALVQIEKALRELVKAAVERIKEEQIDPTRVLSCHACEQKTFVVNGATGACYTCRHQERLAKCPKCGRRLFRRDLQHLIPWAYVRDTPGVQEALENWGDGSTRDPVCPDCYDRLQDDPGVQWEQDLAGDVWANEEFGDEDEDEDGGEAGQELT